MDNFALTEIQSHLESELDSLKGMTFDIAEQACPDLNEFASNVSEAQLRAAMQARTSSAIRDIEVALRRLQNEDYGFCEECGEEIGVARLKARPTATLCVSCQAALEGE